MNKPQCHALAACCRVLIDDDFLCDFQLASADVFGGGLQMLDGRANASAGSDVHAGVEQRHLSAGQR